jgi:hypothetical protein
LLPSTEWPAYRYGKLAFSLAKDAPRKDLLDSLLATDAVFCGFNVEDVAILVRRRVLYERA